METGITSINDLRKQQLLSQLKKKKKMRFSEIFDIYPKTAFSQECGLHTTAFPKKIENPEHIRVDEILKISTYLDVPFDDISKIILEEIKTQK